MISCNSLVSYNRLAKLAQAFINTTLRMINKQVDHSLIYQLHQNNWSDTKSHIILNNY